MPAPAPVRPAAAERTVTCPFLGCPTPRAGTIQPWSAETGTWTATTPDSPGTLHLADSPTLAAVWALHEHADRYHPEAADSALALLVLRRAAHDAARAALGQPARKLATTGECSECGRRLTRHGAAWVDQAGGTRCPDDTELCPNLCPPPRHDLPPADSPCGVCGGDGVIWHLHRPLPDLPARKDGGRR